jgi:hypothetical protein
MIEQHTAQAPALHGRLLFSAFDILRFAFFNAAKAKRHQYWTFDVGCSMFDVQSFQCSGRTPTTSTLKRTPRQRYKGGCKKNDKSSK